MDMPRSERPGAAGASPAAARPEMGFREFVAMMAALMALNALAIDAMLPALPAIGDSLGAASPNERQHVIAWFLFAVGIGSLVHGPLADRFGRRRVLLGALVMYVLLALACALATSFPMLLAGRVLHGIATAAVATIPLAIVRDRYEGDRMARLNSLIFIVFMAVPVLAPTIGQLVLYVADWRWIFGLLAIMGVVMLAWVALRLPETLRPGDERPIRPALIVAGWGAVVRNRDAAGYVLGSALIMGGLFGFINSAQQIFADIFDAAAIFPYAFACVAGTMAVANFANSRIVERFGARRVSHTALFAFIALSVAQVAAASLPHEPMVLFLGLIAVNMAMVGFTGANFGSIAMQPFARMAGVASSFQQAVRMALGAVLGGAIGQAYDGTTRPLALGFLACGICALLMVLFSERGRLFARKVPPLAEPVPPAG